MSKDRHEITLLEAICIVPLLLIFLIGYGIVVVVLEIVSATASLLLFVLLTPLYSLPFVTLDKSRAETLSELCADLRFHLLYKNWRMVRFDVLVIWFVAGLDEEVCRAAYVYTRMSFPDDVAEYWKLNAIVQNKLRAAK